MTGDNEGVSVPHETKKDKGKSVAPLLSNPETSSISTSVLLEELSESEDSEYHEDSGSEKVSESESSDSESDHASEFEEDQEELAGLLEDAHKDIETAIKHSLEPEILPYPSSSRSSLKRHRNN
jgi:hypothetical protein